MGAIGYLRNSPTGLVGTRGSHYDYVLASNGVFLEASGALLVARVMVAAAEVRGLAPMEPFVRLQHGKIPPYLWELATSELMRDPTQERFVAIVWAGAGYALRVPDQVDSAGGIHGIQRQPSTVVDLHSHNSMPAFFSGTDDRDEVGFQVYGVLGRINRLKPEYSLRVGIYGAWERVVFPEVFDGSPGEFIDEFQAHELDVDAPPEGIYVPGPDEVAVVYVPGPDDVPMIHVKGPEVRYGEAT